jgi:hypothetical protein
MKKNDIVSGGRMWRRPAWVLVIALAASPAGCGDGNNYPSLGSSYPVKGKVTLPDGNPLPKVSVVFKGPVTADGPNDFDFKLTQADAAAKDSPGGTRGPAKGH